MHQNLQTNCESAAENRELELKFLTTPAGFKSSQQWPVLDDASPPSVQRLFTRYFDTDQGDLERRHMVLRMRKQGRQHIMTLKWRGGSAAGMFERGEVEAASPGPEPDPALLGPEYVEMLVQVIQDRKLLPIYETDIRRTTRRITVNRSKLEIAFDTGFIRAADHKMPILEIELELKSGDPAELYQLGMSLAQAFPVRLGMQAKAERGAQLRSGATPQVLRAASPLSGAPSIEAAIGSLINACMAQFTGNFPAFEAGDDVNAVHQMRVAMRRLRSILKLFNRAFPCVEFAALSAQARQIATVLGAARNCDVYLKLLRDGPAGAFPEEPGFAPIFALAEQHRAAAYVAIRDLLGAQETTCFILSIQAFIARRGWRNALSAEALVRLSEPAAAFAAGNIHRMHGKLSKRGKHLQRLDPHQRHNLRIGLKNIRYATDLFSGLFSHPKELRAFLRHTARLQDMLGSYNDLITALDLLTKLDATGPGVDHAAGIIAGWCRFGAIPNEEVLLKAWKKFSKKKPLF